MKKAVESILAAKDSVPVFKARAQLRLCPSVGWDLLGAVERHQSNAETESEALGQHIANANSQLVAEVQRRRLDLDEVASAPQRRA